MNKRFAIPLSLSCSIPKSRLCLSSLPSELLLLILSYTASSPLFVISLAATSTSFASAYYTFRPFLLSLSPGLSLLPLPSASAALPALLSSLCPNKSPLPFHRYNFSSTDISDGDLMSLIPLFPPSPFAVFLGNCPRISPDSLLPLIEQCGDRLVLLDLSPCPSFDPEPLFAAAVSKGLYRMDWGSLTRVFLSYIRRHGPELLQSPSTAPLLVRTDPCFPLEVRRSSQTGFDASSWRAVEKEEVGRYEALWRSLGSDLDVVEVWSYEEDVTEDMVGVEAVVEGVTAVVQYYEVMGRAVGEEACQGLREHYGMDVAECRGCGRLFVESEIYHSCFDNHFEQCRACWSKSALLHNVMHAAHLLHAFDLVRRDLWELHNNPEHEAYGDMEEYAERVHEFCDFVDQNVARFFFPRVLPIVKLVSLRKEVRLKSRLRVDEETESLSAEDTARLMDVVREERNEGMEHFIACLKHDKESVMQIYEVHPWALEQRHYW